jgi:hypothetical protein
MTREEFDAAIDALIKERSRTWARREAARSEHRGDAFGR